MLLLRLLIPSALSVFHVFCSPVAESDACNPAKDDVLMPDRSESTRGETYLKCSKDGKWQLENCAHGLKFFFEQQRCLFVQPIATTQPQSEELKQEKKDFEDKPQSDELSDRKRYRYRSPMQAAGRAIPLFLGPNGQLQQQPGTYMRQPHSIPQGMLLPPQLQQQQIYSAEQMSIIDSFVPGRQQQQQQRALPGQQQVVNINGRPQLLIGGQPVVNGQPVNQGQPMMIQQPGQQMLTAQQVDMQRQLLRAQLSGQFIGQQPGQLLGQQPGQLLGQQPGQLLGQQPGQLLGQQPGQLLGQQPGQLLGQQPGQLVNMLPQSGLGYLPGQQSLNQQQALNQHILNTQAALTSGQQMLGQHNIPQPKLPGTVRPGESCLGGEQCSGGSKCSADYGVCSCPDGLSDVDGECVNQVGNVPPGNACSASWQCTKNSHCVNGACTCRPPSVLIGASCVNRVTDETVPRAKQAVAEKAAIGHSCDKGESCTGNSVCNERLGICVCPLGTRLMNGECQSVSDTSVRPTIATTAGSSQPPMILTAPPGGSCASGEICIRGSSCVNQRCACLPGFTLSGSACIPVSPTAQTTTVKATTDLASALSSLPSNPTIDQVYDLYIKHKQTTGQPVPSLATTTPAPPTVRSWTTDLSDLKEEWLKNIASYLSTTPQPTTGSKYASVPPFPTLPPSNTAKAEPSTNSYWTWPSAHQTTGAWTRTTEEATTNQVTGSTWSPTNQVPSLQTNQATGSTPTTWSTTRQATPSTVKPWSTTNHRSTTTNMWPTTDSEQWSTQEAGSTANHESTESTPTDPSGSTAEEWTMIPITSSATTTWRSSETPSEPATTKAPYVTYPWTTNRVSAPVEPTEATSDLTLTPDFASNLTPSQLAVLNELLAEEDGEDASPTATNFPATTTTKPLTTTSDLLGSVSWNSQGTTPTWSGNALATTTAAAQSVAVNEGCTSNMDCSIGAYCHGLSANGHIKTTCRCLSTHVVVDGRCLRIIYPGQTGCESDDQCSASFEGSRCLARQCECPPGSAAVGQTCRKANIDMTGVVEFSAPGGSCSEGQHCVGASVCREGACVCDDGMMAKGDKCVKRTTVHPPKAKQASAVKYGAACDDSSICDGNAECLGGVCQCNIGQLHIEGRCITPAAVITARPGAPCASGERCVGGSACDGRNCVCSQGNIARNGVCVRITSPPLGPCSNGEDCTGGSTCDGIVCQCVDGFAPYGGLCTLSTTNGPTTIQALPARNVWPGDRCFDGQICRGGSFCVHTYCLCPAGGVNIGGKCRRLGHRQPSPTGFTSSVNPLSNGFPSGLDLSKLLSSREFSGGSNFDGFTSSLDLSNGFTSTMDLPSVADVLVESSPKNLDPLSHPGDPCVATNDCTGGSLCLHGFCVCPPGMTPKGLICTREEEEVVIGASLESYPGDPCNEALTCVGRSVCRKGFCVCPLGLESRNGECVLPSNMETDFRRMSSSYRGRGGVTVQETNIFESNEAGPGEICQVGLRDCIGSSICSMGQCRCPVGMHSEGRRCLPDGKLVKPGSPCAESQLCIGGSTCEHGLCTCAKGYKIVQNICKPVLPSRRGPAAHTADNMPCRGPQDCTGGSYCNNGRCSCLPGMSLQAGQCQKASAKTSRPGGFCGGGNQCVGGAYCNSRTICECPPGTVDISGMCQPPGSIAFGGPSTSDGLRARPNFFKPNASRPGMADPCPGVTVCRLPDCFCTATGKEIPGGLNDEETPQFVILSLDDAVNDKTMDLYRKIFDGRFKNPNGCPIRGTFFVSHEWTNYDDAQWLSYAGHELASNSMTHENLRKGDVRRWNAEMDGLRLALNKFASVSPSEVVGARSPQFNVNEDMYKSLKSSGFLYDNSMSANPGEDGLPFWPQTLDYLVPWECQNGECPQAPYKGLWEVPINQFYGYFIDEINSYKRSSMLNAALTEDEGVQAAVEIIRKNFNRAYESNKAPYVLTLNSGFLNTALGDDGTGLTALEQFLNEISNRPDVWVVTMQQLIEWMKTPGPSTDLASRPSMQCSGPNTNTPRPCSTSNKCLYKTPQLNTGEHLFKTCQSCPKRYPWLHNAEGV